jgi:hypothetical protein
MNIPKVSTICIGYNNIWYKYNEVEIYIKDTLWFETKWSLYERVKNQFDEHQDQHESYF